MSFPSKALILVLLTSLSSAQGGANRAQKQVPKAQVYVDDSATGAGDGSSWTNAFTDLQAALSATQSGDIWVAAGTYFAGPANDQMASFVLKNGVAIYGGFNATETTLTARDPANNPTILSGDINGDDTYGSGLAWWRFGWNGNPGNSYHIVTGSGNDASAVLDGFTLFAGSATEPSNQRGGGLYVDGGSPSIRNCVFQYNGLGYGSSAWLMDSNSVFEDCVVRDGYTCNCGAGGQTSGIIIDGSSAVSFLRTDFLNHYFVANNNGDGAALQIEFNSQATLVDCRFEGNQTGNFYAIGGGTAYGAGIVAFGDLIIDRCEFIDNFAHAGAGVTAWSNVTMTNSLFAQNVVVSHPNSSGFDDGGYGAGFLTVGFGSKNINVANCTFVDNKADKGGGFAIYGQSTASISNTISYFNYGDAPAPGEDPVFILKRQAVGSFDINNSCVEGLLQTEPGEDAPDPANFPGCFDSDPGLASVGLQDYQLEAGSTCIDAGDSSGLISTTGLDLSLNGRFFDDPLTPDSGTGPQPAVDIGCYEFGSAMAISSGSNSTAPRLRVDQGTLSLSQGGVAALALSAGPGNAGQPFRLVASIRSHPATLPFERGATSWMSLDSALRQGPSPFVRGMGFLDESGAASASLRVPRGSHLSLVGLQLMVQYVIGTDPTRQNLRSAPVFVSLGR